MREPVTLYKMGEVRTFVRDGWHFSPRGWLAWLQRVLWWALVKMGAVAPHMKETIEVVRLPCDADGVLGKIMEAREGMFRAYREPSEVLIGPDTLAELLVCPELRGWNSPFTMDARAERSTMRDDGRGEPRIERRMFNLPVHVVPTMEGVIVR